MNIILKMGKKQPFHIIHGLTKIQKLNPMWLFINHIYVKKNPDILHQSTFVENTCNLATSSVLTGGLTTADTMTHADRVVTRHFPTFNTLRPRQNGRHFADGTFRLIFLNENVKISTKISLKFVPMGPINNIPALV